MVLLPGREAKRAQGKRKMWNARFNSPDFHIDVGDYKKGFARYILTNALLNSQVQQEKSLQYAKVRGAVDV